MRGRRWCLRSAAAAIVGIAGLVLAMANAPVARAQSPRRVAPAFSLADSTGKQVSLAALRGRVVQLDFWATWCASCKVEIPWFQEFQAKYGAKGLSSIGVAMDVQGWSIVKPYLAKDPFNYPVVLGDDELARKYEVPGLPVTVLIDRSGRIAESHIGLVDKGAWENKIQALLQERPR